jgi:DNA replication and repair protein RecF
MLGVQPILLLDDVMSELDEDRRHALTAQVGNVAQTIITTTNIEYFDSALLERAKVIQIGQTV